MAKKPLAFLGCDAPVQVAMNLKKLEFEACVLPIDKRLPAPVRSHADMLMLAINNNIFCNKEYLACFPCASLLKEYGYKIIACNNEVCDQYPQDVSFNLALIGDHIFGRLDSAAEETLAYADRHNIISVNVKQGYTKCSTVVLNGNAIITADSGIAATADQKGIRVLKIKNSPSAVRLSGYDYGFLGGACGVFENKIYFTGDISSHPDGKAILDFCYVNGMEVICVLDGQLTDIGGIIFLPPIA